MKKLMAVAILALLAISASATTVSFVPPAGGFPSGGGFLPGNATSVTIGGIAINGYTLSGLSTTNLSAAPLFGRSESGDSGIGVCSSGETCTVPGGGDSNELSNGTNQEVLRLTLPGGNTWVSVTLSSLDNNSGSGAPERGVIATDGPGNTFTVICSFAGSGAQGNGTFTACTQSGGSGGEPVFSIPALYANASHLYFVPFDWTLNGNTNNDFLVRAATITSAVPEPGSLALMGSGLLALAGVIRRRIRL